MSIARITKVQKSLKPGTCEKCKAALPKGSGYLWFKVGFRSRNKRVRCLKTECYPKDSERESSLLSEVYAAKEAAEEQVAEATSAEEMKDLVTEYAEAVREVASQYEEAMTDDQGNVFNTTAEERYEALEQAADDIESAADDIDDTTTECEACAGTGEIPCETCEGEGSVLPEGATDPVDCSDCAGTGNVECEADDCEDGQVPDLDGMREIAQGALDTDLGC